MGCKWVLGKMRVSSSQVQWVLVSASKSNELLVNSTEFLLSVVRPNECIVSSKHFLESCMGSDWVCSLLICIIHDATWLRLKVCLQALHQLPLSSQHLPQRCASSFTFRVVSAATRLVPSLSMSMDDVAFIMQLSGPGPRALSMARTSSRNTSWKNEMS